MDTPNAVSSSEIKKFLVRRLGEKEGEEIMAYINEEVKKEVALKVDDVHNEIALWRNEMKNVFATKEDAQHLQTKLVRRVSRAESTLILWGFVFWLTTLIAVLCFIKFFK